MLGKSGTGVSSVIPEANLDIGIGGWCRRSQGDDARAGARYVLVVELRFVATAPKSIQIAAFGAKVIADGNR